MAQSKKPIINKVVRKLPKIKKIEEKPVVTFRVRDDNVIIFIDDNDYGFEFSFGTESLPNCCGVIEAGGFSLDEDSPHIKAELKVNAVKEGLKQMIAYRPKKSFIITTIPNDKECNLVVDAIKDGELFTPVKTFKNSSGNMITIWVSNN